MSEATFGPEQQPEPEVSFDPNRTLMSQILGVVAPNIVRPETRDEIEKRIQERDVDAINAEELRH